MLVLDLDDTLLRDDHSISTHTKESLTKAQKLGVKVVLASGRPTPAMVQYASELQLAQYDSYLISFNGAVVTSLKIMKSCFRKALPATKYIVCMILVWRTTCILSLIRTREL